VKKEERSKDRPRLSLEKSKKERRTEGKKRGKGIVSFLFSYIYSSTDKKGELNINSIQVTAVQY
jgi:hypothetical protein